MKKTTAKKIICLLLAVILGLAWAGCSEKEGTDSSNDTDMTDGVFCESGEIVPENGTYTITSGGEYTVIGEIAGSIVVDAGDDEVVLILAGASVTSSDNAPIMVKSADEVNIHCEDDTVNVIKDMRNGSDDAEEYDGAVWADCDLKITGHGCLSVSSEYTNGVKSTKDVKIKNVTLTVQSRGIALKGNDTVTVESGDIELISTDAEGIKTRDSDISSKGNQRGIIRIASGDVRIFSAGDGISSAFDTEIGGSGELQLTIVSGTYSQYTSSGFSASKDSKGIASDNDITILSGRLSVSCPDDALHAEAGNSLDNGNRSTGNIVLGTADITIICGDDAVHADGSVTIDGSGLTITGSHEGIEANVITVISGNVVINANDDGINATAGSSPALIDIRGGYVEVNTPSGDTDAIDSNGNITVSGGTVLVKSHNNMGRMGGSMDCDGTLTVSGGTVIAFGGICAVPSSGSVCTYVNSSATFDAGEYALRDSEGKTIVSFSLDASYSSVMIASEDMELSGSYSLERDGSGVITWKQDSAVTGSYSGGGPGF